MKVIKNINNNCALCVDNAGKELVAFGKGIGFTKPPYEIDLSLIRKTYYEVDESYINLIKEIPKEILMIAEKIEDFAEDVIDNQFSRNIVFTLADHIDFAIIKFYIKLNITMPILYDVKHLYENEYEVGIYALNLIKEELKIDLPKEEAAYIAMHFVNAEAVQSKTPTLTDYEGETINFITEIIEETLDIWIDRDGFNYSRFVTHMYYLFKKSRRNNLNDAADKELYVFLSKSYPKITKCAERVSKLLRKRHDIKLPESEEAYLILHIIRMCAREDCYQEKGFTQNTP